MGDDEIMVTVVSGFAALIMWGLWFAGSAALADSFYRNGKLKQASMAGGVAVAILLFVILKLWSSGDVRDAPQYLVQYWLMGAFVAALTGVVIAPLMGISHREDVCERHNPAAAYAWVGVVGGFTLAYAGSNVGNGPGWWVVVFCSMLSCGFLWLVWFGLELAFHISELITVERDVSAGMRFGGLMLGMGIVAGRGAAGDWTSAANAVTDFVSVVVPALPLVLGAAVVELALRAKPGAESRNATIFGALPGIAFALGGFFYVWLLKPW